MLLQQFCLSLCGLPAPCWSALCTHVNQLKVDYWIHSECTHLLVVPDCRTAHLLFACTFYHGDSTGGGVVSAGASKQDCSWSSWVLSVWSLHIFLVPLQVYSRYFFPHSACYLLTVILNCPGVGVSVNGCFSAYVSPVMDMSRLYTHRWPVDPVLQNKAGPKVGLMDTTDIRSHKTLAISHDFTGKNKYGGQLTSSAGCSGVFWDIVNAQAGLFL